MMVTNLLPFALLCARFTIATFCEMNTHREACPSMLYLSYLPPAQPSPTHHAGVTHCLTREQTENTATMRLETAVLAAVVTVCCVHSLWVCANGHSMPRLSPHSDPQKPRKNCKNSISMVGTPEIQKTRRATTTHYVRKQYVIWGRHDSTEQVLETKPHKKPLCDQLTENLPGY